MSIRALDYAVACIKRDGCTLGSPARLVFVLLANSANHQTGLAFTGTWLSDQTGLDISNVRRHLHTLRDAGYVRIEERVGQASIVTFPTAAYLSTAPRDFARGQVTSDPSRFRETTPRDFARPPLAISRDIPGSIPDYFNSDNNLEVIAREATCCDMTGWVYNEDTDDVSPCPLHHPRGKAARL